MELSKDTITWYVNGTRYMEHKGLPPETQLPDEFLNGNLYVYFVSWVYRNTDNRETTRFHWDRVAVNPKNSSGQILPPSAAPGFNGPVPPTPTSAPSVPTATRTPTPVQATATRTPTTVPNQPTPLPPSGGGLTTVSFNDLPGEQRVLSGQYPAGVLDWGNGAWWLSKPYGQLGSKNLSHNGSAGVTSGSFSFLQPGRLVSLKAYNGGGGASTVTLSCAGKPTKSTSVAAGQLVTIETGWTGTCGAVTLASSNGWETNFDDLVIDLSSPSTPSTVTFDDRPGQNQPLDGQYPAGVINWGSGQWYHAGPSGALTSKSASLTDGRTSASFSFVTPSRLTSLKAYNAGGPTIITLACSGQPTKIVSLGTGQVTTISTGWTGECVAVTVTSSNGWDTNFDDLNFD